jgi:hypothetical protein
MFHLVSKKCPISLISSAVNKRRLGEIHMSIRMHRFIPLDPHFIPLDVNVQTALIWLRSHIDAYQIETVIPEHIIFFDCGGIFDDVLCPQCRKDIGPLWKQWMDESYTQDAGFALSSRALDCCGADVRLDQLIFDAHCAFGSFGIDMTDTMTTLSDAEVTALMEQAEVLLSCKVQHVDAHY